MFGWRRRSEGFEWREHVRTTVLVRRADRQRRIDGVREAAIAKVQDARNRGFEVGKAGVDAAAGVASSAASKAGQGLWAGALIAGRGVGGALLKAGSSAGALARAAGERMPRGHARDGDRASDCDATDDGAPSPTVRKARLAEQVNRREQAKAYLDDARKAAPKLNRAVQPKPRPDTDRRTINLSDFDFSAMRTRLVAGVTPWLGIAGKVAAGLVVIVFGGQMLRSGDGGDLSSTTTGSISRAAAPSTSTEWTGRAIAVAGDRLRLNGRDLRLAGIAAPEDNQPCLTANGRRWNCQAAARRALERLMRSKSVSCVANGEDASGLTIATCTLGAEGDDIARSLVRDGHVFAANTMFSSYKADEEPAKAEKKGLWQGDTVHPDTWRERVWEEAKRTAPDGCPIKGVVSATARTYAMPWSSAYSGARFRSTKAQQWFCSEDDARAAGFRAAGTGALNNS